MDRRIGQELLKVIAPLGVEASLRALEALSANDTAQRAALSRKLEQLVYEARKAFEQYDAVDARNRLVASELERRWDAKLEEIEVVESNSFPVWMLSAIPCQLKTKSEYTPWVIYLPKSGSVTTVLRHSRR